MEYEYGELRKGISSSRATFFWSGFVVFYLGNSVSYSSTMLQHMHALS